MTPDKDVNKEADSETTDTQPEADENTVTETADTAVSGENSSSEQEEPVVEHAGELVDDIERAADAQSAESEARANGDDDPLGFGDQRMPESEENDGLAAKLADAEAKVSSHADQLSRLQAEMENQRKRAQKDVTNAHKFALEKFATDLLPVKDSLEMGLAAATGDDADLQKIIEGSELTLKMLAQALEKYNIVEVNPVDEKFDPEFHQAMSMAPVEGKEPNTVASVMQKGYTLNDRLIRPALVMVAK